MVGDQVDYEESLRLLEESSDPARTHLRREAPAAPPAAAAPAEASAGAQPLSHNATFNKARTADQVFVARIRELDYKERIGELIPIRDVEQAEFTAGRITRDRVLMVPARLAADLHALALSLVPEAQREAFGQALQVHALERRLEDALRDALSAAAKAIENARRDDDEPDD